MTTTIEPTVRAITMDEVVPHAPETVWKVLTTSELIARWLMQNDFTPGLGKRFTLRATPMGDWDGTVRCQIITWNPPRELAYSWVGGSTGNPDYGAALDSTLTWTLTPVAGGTRVRMVHDGFRSPRNDFAFTEMSRGWSRVVTRIGELASDV
jgi:uncharacterized protein YndB with AHSA1/START domain